MLDTKRIEGVWSAAPTPLTEGMELDAASVERMVEHHVRLGINGLFLLGTNGEGPWLPDKVRHELVRKTVRCGRGRMLIAVQVTDNSAARILDNVRMAKEDGADIAVISSPYFLVNATTENIGALYMEVIDGSSLPIGIYDCGKFSPTFVPDAVLQEIYKQEKVILIKDSSMSPSRLRIALSARKKRPELRLLNGYEWDCISYLKSGYDGLLLGGGIFNGYMAGLIIKAVKDGDIELARHLQERMNRIMWAVYGGRKLRCWLRGEKELLVRMGIFETNKTILRYPITDGCRKAIQLILEKDRDVLFPYR